MSRKFVAVVLPLVVFALLSPREAVAGPPEGVKGAMTFDAVADGLRRYRQEADPEKKIQWLSRLTPTNDPRVAVAVGEALDEESGPVYCAAIRLAVRYYCPQSYERLGCTDRGKACRWWSTNAADLRRRAANLPR